MTTDLRVVLDQAQTWFTPFATVKGEAAWSTASDPDAIEIRLFWYTRGKGTDEAEVVEHLRIARPGRSGSRRFSLQLPDGPYSFSGKLITLAWALELVVVPSNESSRIDLVVGPRPVEVDIRSLREP